MSSLVSFQVNGVRGQQLRLIAAERGLGIAETLEDLIASEVARGALPARTLPGLVVALDPPAITFAIGNAAPIDLDAKHAAEIAATARDFLAGRTTGTMILMDSGVVIGRVGPTFFVERLGDRLKIKASKGVMEELALQLEEAVAALNALQAA